MASFAFEVLECRLGDLRLVEPSHRGYERYYLALAVLIAVFLLPFLSGLLPWQVLVRGGTQGLPPATIGLALLYFIVAIGTIIAWVLYAPRLAERQPRKSMPVVVLESQFGRNPNSPPRLHVRAGDDTFWLTVQAKAADLRHGLTFAGQTSGTSAAED